MTNKPTYATALIDQPNERVLIARKGGEGRGDSASSIIAFRGTESAGDTERWIRGAFGRGTRCVDEIGGVPVSRLMEENGIDGVGIRVYIELFNSVLSDIQKVLYRRGDSLILTGHSAGGILAQYGALESYAKRREPIDSVITFGSPPAFEGPVVSFFDSIITHERYFFSNDLVPKIGHGHHTGNANKLVYYGHGDGMLNHGMLKYLEAIES